MVKNKTLAQNHLSELARQGRGGDTELAHVNPQEKAMLKSMGGSGTINPNTGLREYTGLPVDPLTATLFGVSVIGGAVEQGKKRAAARLESRFLGDQIVETEQAIESAEKKKEADTNVAVAEYQTAGESLGLSKAEAQKQLDEAIKKSNLVTSAGVTGKESNVWRQFGIQAKGLYGHLGKTLGKVEEWFAGQTSVLKGTIKQLTFQKQLADKASKEKYLGIF